MPKKVVKPNSTRELELLYRAANMANLRVARENMDAFRARKIDRLMDGKSLPYPELLDINPDGIKKLKRYTKRRIWRAISKRKSRKA